MRIHEEEQWGALTAATTTLVNLLAHREYDVIEAMIEGRRFSAEELRRLIEKLEVQPIEAGGDRWEKSLDVSRVIGLENTAYDVLVPLWSADGLSQLTLELRLVERIPDILSIEIVDLRRPLRGEPRHPPVGPPGQRRPARQEPPTPNPGSVPIPERWRSRIADIVHRLAAGDFAGLARDGFVSYTNDPGDASIGVWIEEYSGTLIDLPDEAWAWSAHGPIDDLSDKWWVELPLWTTEEGYSDLTLEGTVQDDGVHIDVKIDGVHVM